MGHLLSRGVATWGEGGHSLTSTEESNTKPLKNSHLPRYEEGSI